ncbi:acyltransferase GLAUCE-like [Diospyros lotus]|uniref:acyltransferase GLAUCE-like n=1 Tax=Diospyros lotus TaxID=55363 RepID=UPI002254DE3A|nr:acyltransferase GLAUCE-like [Diospyros lotus]
MGYNYWAGESRQLARPLVIGMETTGICLTDQDVIKQEPVNLFSPSNPTPMETIFLSNIDQAVVFPVETVFFFQVPPAGNASSTAGISEVVTKAVAEELLVPYYFMAGRLGFDRGGKRLELLCNNGGVPFVSAVSGLSLKDLGDLSLPNSSFHWLVHRPGLYKSLAQTPIFTIQVTRFECGGFALGFMTNHSILDGKSASEMFHKLASICRGEEEALKLKTLALHNDRTPLRARNPPLIKFPHEEYIQPQNPSSLPTSFTSQNRTSPSPLIFSKMYDHRLFHFTPSELTSLKQKAAAKCSTFEAIVAHIWKARTKAVFPNPDDFSTVLFAVDIRSKTSPPLPSGFVGNAVTTAFASAKVGDLAEKPLAFCVEKVKEARDRVTDEYVRSVVDWLEVYKGIPATCNGNFYVSAWWKLGFGELDFGFGKAVHGGPVVSGNDEFVLLLGDGGGENGGGVNVWLGLEREKMKKFMVYVYEM